MNGMKIEINGILIYYEKHGSGSIPILLIPGGTGSIHTDLKPLINALSKTKYTIIAFDPPGYGKSRPPDRDYNNGIQMYHNDSKIAIELMSKLNYKSFSLLGWSDGGRTGLVTAINYPSKVEKLIVWGSAPIVTKRQQMALETAENLKMWEDLRRIPFKEEYGSIEAAQEMWSKHVLYYKTIGDICSNDLGKIRCPTLILHGERDLIEKNLIDDMMVKIGDANLFKIPDGGHNIHLTHTDTFVREVENFLDDWM